MKIENLEINESDGVIILNNKTYRAESEAVMSDIQRNVKEVVHTVQFCIEYNVHIHTKTSEQFDAVLNIYLKHNPKDRRENMWIGDGDQTTIYFNSNEWLRSTIDDCKKRNYTIIPAERFIKDNQPATVEQAEPKWCESWEVLEMKTTNYVWEVTENGEYANKDNCKYTLQELLAVQDATIHRIRNKQSGEVFTVGDKVERKGEVETIKSMHVSSDLDGVWAYTGKTSNINLSCYKPYKPLFTTHDGVDVFDGMPYVYINNKFEIKPKINTSGWAKTVYEKCIESGGKYFSTHEAVVGYIILNKPCFRVADFELIMKEHNVHFYTRNILIDALKALVKL